MDKKLGFFSDRMRSILFFIFFAMGVIGGGIVFYNYEKDTHWQQSYLQIASVAELKINQIQKWREERISDVSRTIEEPCWGKDIEQYMYHRGDKGSEYPLQKLLALEQRLGQYARAFILSTDGKLLLTDTGRADGQIMFDSVAFRQTLASKKPILSDLVCGKDGTLYIDGMAVINGAKDTPLAIVVLRSDVNVYLFPLIQSWPTPSRTSETLIIRKLGSNIVFLNKFRHAKDLTAAGYLPITTPNLPAAQAALGKVGLFEGTDYRGVEVLADLRPVPSTTWFMVAKVDTDEILSEVKFRAVMIAVAVGLIILCSGAVVAYSSHRRQANLFRSLYESELAQRHVEKEFRTTLYSIGDGVITTDIEGHVKWMNPIAESLTGWQEFEAHHKPLHEVFHIINESTRRKVENPVERVIRDGRVVGLANHTVLISRNGEERPIADSAAPIRDAENSIFGVVLVFRDQTTERKRQNELFESESLLRQAQQLAQLGHYMFEIQAGTWTSSDMLDAIFGIPENFQKTIESLLSIIHPDDREEISNELRTVLLNKQSFDKEFRIVRINDGIERWVHGLGILEMNEADKPIKLFGVIQDITPRRQSEDALAINEKRLRQIIDLVPHFIFAKDNSGKFILVNQAVADAYGTTVRELTGKMDADFAKSEEEVRHFREDDNSVIASGLPKIVPEEQITDATGNVHILATQKIPFTFSGTSLPALLGISVDITKQKQAEEVLAAERERLVVTLRSIGDGVITTDLDGRIVLMNRIAEELTGWPSDDAVGKPLTEVFHIINEHTRESCLNPVEEVLKTKSVIELANHTLLISRSGREFVIADSGAPIRDRNSNIIGVVLVFRDMTEKQKLYENIQRADKLQSLGILAGGLAHDFNNLLGGLFGYLDLAREHTLANEKAKTYIDKALLTFNRAKDLTQQLLTFSKGGAPNRTTGSLENALNEHTNFALSGSKITAHFAIQPGLWLADFDENQIGQVINNLVLNAQQAMPMGGSIIVSASNMYLTSENGVALPDGNYVRFSISDSGTGVPQTMLHRIFDPFFTTKQKGSGLGLTTAYSIIKKHDGTITVESSQDKGTTFHIYLPASEREVTTSATVDVPKHRGDGRILVMDDEEAIRETTKEMLARLGYTAECAANGQEAVELFHTAAIEGNPFKAVIMDLTIPGGIGGKEAIVMLRKVYPEVVAFVSSGYSNDPVLSHPEEFGFTDKIQKPFRLDELSHLLHRHLEKRS
jgi:PAS domain S-box-containing protein